MLGREDINLAGVDSLEIGETLSNEKKLFVAIVWGVNAWCVTASIVTKPASF